MPMVDRGRSHGARFVAALGLILGVALVAAPVAGDFVPGDVNDDGSFDTADAVVLERDLIGLGPGVSQTCPFQPNATGQITCWNSSGSVIPCTATGHDGDIRAGEPAAYQDNGDGTVTDLRTSLMWEKLSDDGSVHDVDDSHSWDGAFAAKVALLNATSFAGYDDWRVPNVKELFGILDLQTFDPAVAPSFDTACVPSCGVTACSCTAFTGGSEYWSSTSDASAPANAWVVEFARGDVASILKTGNAKVRAVRGPGDGLSCTNGNMRLCGVAIGECSTGTETCVDEAWSGVCVGEAPPGLEVCDGLDNDCNSVVDDPSSPDLCPPAPNVASATCAAATCQVVSCDSTWHDLNGVHADGCECQEDSNDQGGLGAACNGAVDLGSLPDDGTTVIQVTGNFVPSGDSDWYRVVMLDTNDTQHMVIQFASNPGNQFRIATLFAGICGGTDVCSGLTPLQFVYEGFQGQNDSRTFYIQVIRDPAAPPTCIEYTLEIRSEAPIGSFVSQCNG